MTDLFTPAERDATLARLLERLETDPRLEAAFIAGSLGSEKADRWSDLDVATVVADGQAAEVVAEDWLERIRDEFGAAHHYRVEFGSTIVTGFLLPNGLEIDLSFTPTADLQVWETVRVAFDRIGGATAAARNPVAWSPSPDWSGEAGLAWHDVVHAAVAINRGRPWRALLYLQRVRNQTLSLASERHGWDADEFARVDDLPAPERDPLLASLVGSFDEDALRASLRAATEAFRVELARGKPELAKRLEQPLRLYVESGA